MFCLFIKCTYLFILAPMQCNLGLRILRTASPYSQCNMQLKTCQKFVGFELTICVACVWMMPYAKPSLSIMAKLETQLATDSPHSLSWSALNVYRNQPPKNYRFDCHCQALFISQKSFCCFAKP